MGKTDNYKNSYVGVQEVPVFQDGNIVDRRQFKIGDYLIVRVKKAGPRSLYCDPIGIASQLPQYYKNINKFEKM